MMKILGPVVRFVDRPWKVLLPMRPYQLPHDAHQMYPVGVLFGFGKGAVCACVNG